MGSPNVALSTLEARIQISARSRDIEAIPLELTYLPPIYVSTKEILFINPHSQTVPIATLDIFGLRSVLEHVTVSYTIFLHIKIVECVIIYFILFLRLKYRME